MISAVCFKIVFLKIVERYRLNKNSVMFPTAEAELWFMNIPYIILSMVYTYKFT